MGNIFKGAAETLRNNSATRKADKRTKGNIEQIAVNRARSRYRTLTGVDIPPSRVKDEMIGGFISKDVKNYMKLRDQQNAKLREKFGF